jgi:DNA-binding NarL/FixJ family response regulator
LRIGEFPLLWASLTYAMMDTRVNCVAVAPYGEEGVSDPIRISILDDDDSFRQRARAWLTAAGDIAVVGEAKGGQEAITLIHETRPDVVLLNISASRASSLQMVGQICESFPQTRIIVLDDDGEEQLALEAFRKGALGHLVKRKAQPAEIIGAIRAVVRGKAILSPGVAGRILDKVIQERHRTAEHRASTEPDSRVKAE